MRKVVVLVHTSLDGFLAGKNREMDWVKFDDELWEYVNQITDNADTAIYGRITYELMEGYWPTAATKPSATNHDIHHSNWVNNAVKIVFSKTMEKSNWKGTQILRGNMKREIEKLKKEPGKNLLLLGSASIIHSFAELDLIDEYWININPVLLGEGIPLFKNAGHRTNLELVQTKNFNCGVTGLRYAVKHA